MTAESVIRDSQGFFGPLSGVRGIAPHSARGAGPRPRQGPGDVSIRRLSKQGFHPCTPLGSRTPDPAYPPIFSAFAEKMGE